MEAAAKRSCSGSEAGDNRTSATGTEEREDVATAARPPAATEVDQWLERFGAALEQGDAAGAAELFAQESYWRDLVAFTWNIKTVEGRGGITDMLEHTLARVQPHGWHATEEPTTADGVTDAWIAFETRAWAGARGICG